MSQANIRLRAVTIALVLAVTATARIAAQAASEPLSIARQGYMFAGGKYSNVNGRQVMSGQLYAEFQIPSTQSHPWPIVMIHGGSQSGTNFTGTPDGREGWAQFFLRQGYAVYVVDQPGRGRAAYQPDRYGPAAPLNLETTQRQFAAPERYNRWPQARLHTQWPGQGAPGDPVFDQFYASQIPSIQDFTLQQELNRDAILALLEKIGPSILLTHSQSGAFGWPVADARPDLVKAILAVEPNGPPFFNIESVPAPVWFRDAAPPQLRPWGVTAVPLAYSPAAAKASDLAIVQQDKPDGPDLVRCWLQATPARSLPGLQKLPILILTAEASYHAPYDHCTVKYLEQAGVRSTWTKLGDVGIHGNGHMMMLEKNNLEIAALIARWLDDALPATATTGTRANAPRTESGRDASAFEVASVKQNTSGSGQRSAGFQPGGRFRASNMTLRGLIAAAYGAPQPLPLYRVVGGPGWIDSDRFDVDARATTDFADLPGQPGWSAGGQQMLKTLLARRFRLVVRQETRELPSYALVKARSDGRLGPQLIVSPAGECRPAPPPAAPRVEPVPCGGFRFTPPERVNAHHLTMDEIARFIMLNAVDRPVLNRTELTGHFDVELEFTRGLQPPPQSPVSATERDPTFTGTSIFTALQEQLGLRLEPIRSPLEVVIIEDGARPEPD